MSIVCKPVMNKSARAFFCAPARVEHEDDKEFADSANGDNDADDNRRDNHHEGAEANLVARD